MQRGVIVVIVSLLLFASCGCKPKQENSDRATISIIPKGTSHVYWKSIHAGALKAALECDVTINWIGPEKEDDRQQQIALVDNQVMNQVSGIILAPIDNMALRRPVRAAVSKGVPVVIIDSDLKDSQDVYTSYIATDNHRGGEIAAQQMAAQLQNKGWVIALREAEGAASTEMRVNGFLAALASVDGITVVSADQYVGVTKAQAQQAAENLLLRFANDQGGLKIQGIFCPNESTTYGMLQALRRKRLTGKVVFIGFDCSEPLLVGLRQGEINGLVVQDPFKMGYLSVKTMVSHLKGDTVIKMIDTGVSFVTQANLEQPEIQALVYPDLQQWLGD